MNIKLDEECEACSGRGDSFRGEGVCMTCFGRGRVLTDAGQDLFDFFQSWARVDKDGRIYHRDGKIDRHDD